MSRVRGVGNRSTEIRLIRLFKEASITGWRRNQRLTGRPDFVFAKHRVALFVDGCFWHGCSYHGTQPATNRLFWENKLKQNKERDRFVTTTLEKNGWRVLRIWQHELVLKQRDSCVKKIRRALARPASPSRDQAEAPDKCVRSDIH